MPSPVQRPGATSWPRCPAFGKKSDKGCLGAEESLHTCAPLPTDCSHLNDAAIRINRDHRDDTAVGEEDMVKRTISVHENLLALAANVFQLRHESLEVAGGQGEQKPIAGPI
jgi:hypothetical protein